MNSSKYKIEPAKLITRRNISVQGTKCLKKYDFIDQTINRIKTHHHQHSANISWKTSKNFYGLKIFIDKARKMTELNSPQDLLSLPRKKNSPKQNKLLHKCSNYISLSKKRQNEYKKSIKKIHVPSLKPLNFQPSPSSLTKVNTEKLPKYNKEFEEIIRL